MLPPHRPTIFLEEAFRTDYYRIDIAFNDDGSWTYVTRTDLALRGKTPPFNHHDTNTLRRDRAPATKSARRPAEGQQSECDVIVSRWERLTGKSAMHAETTRRFEDIAAERLPTVRSAGKAHGVSNEARSAVRKRGALVD